MTIIKQNKYIIFIYTSLPGYMFNCIEELACSIQYKVIVVETSENKNYPVRFLSKNFEILSYTVFKEFIRHIHHESIIKVFIAGWSNNKIIQLTNYFFKNKVRLVLLSDQPRKNNIKQRIAKLFIKFYLNKFENIIVPGKAAFELMLYYGVEKEKVRTGLYTATEKIFNTAKIIRDSKVDYPKAFLFDGQFINRKGVKFLINEYLDYLKISKDPWKLIMVGKGELESIIPSQIQNFGFIHQDKLGDIYSNAGCFVLPSYEDHWPLVIHQATSAGLPLLISPYCYSHYEFFRQNENGYFIDPYIQGSLTKAMLKIENSNFEKLRTTGETSYKLSKAFSVEKWVFIFNEIINK